MKRLLCAGMALGFPLLAGCASLTIKSDTAEDVDFSAYTTFAVAPPPTEVKNLIGYSEIVGLRIQDAIIAGFQAKGYVQSEESEADLLVAFGLGGEPRTNIYADRTFGAWYGNTTWYSTDYIVGTLSIDVFDRAAEKLIWHGWGTKEFFENQTDQDGAVKAVGKIVGQFPKKAGP